MNPRHTIALALAATVATAPTVLAGDDGYTFINIADSTGPLSNTSGHIVAAVINDNGVVAFYARLDDTTQHRLYTGNGGELTTIAAAGPGQEFTSLGHPSINNSGEVAFRAGNDRIYKSSGGSIIPITPGSPYTNTGEFPRINDAGVVAFKATFDSWQGVFTGSGGAITTEFIASDGVFLTLGDPDMNNAGEVAFNAHLWPGTGTLGIFRGSSGSYTTIADNTGPFQSFAGRVDVNADGRVIFLASFDTGGAGIYTGTGGKPDEITTSISGPYAIQLAGDFPRAINDLGLVAFTANLGLDVGIFTGPNPATDTVIKKGDTLFGSSVVVVKVVRGGINNHGDIAFEYGLTNGVQGIAVAKAQRKNIVGDLNNDGHVDVLDLLILLGSWGNCPKAGDCPADLNNSGTVDVQDLLILLSNWG